MKKSKNKHAIAMLTALLLLTGCNGAQTGNENTAVRDNLNDAEAETDSSIPSPALTVTPTYPAPDSSVRRPTRPVTATIMLADGDITVHGNGASADGSTLTITDDGVYEITGTLSDGQIIVDSSETAIVELVLAGVDITNHTNAAIWCKNADDCIITLAGNTNNVLTDAVSYTYADTVNEEPDAALFSKCDLNIGGTGWLTVNANWSHGIYSRDDLEIEGGGFIVTSAVDAIRGKDSLTITNGRFHISAGGDGFQSTNEEEAERGWILLSGGEYDIHANGDAVQAETSLTVDGGVYTILTDGKPAGTSDSQKGFKAGTDLIVEDGTFTLKTKDDAFHANADTLINGGIFLIATDDDGIHADRNLTINGGEISIPDCYEGFEGTIIEVNGGKSFIDASDDAVSAAAGTPEAEEWSGRNGNPYVYAVFNGGEVEAVSGGDTVDSNGNIFVNGGTLRLSAPPYPDYEGSLLCNGDVTITGGNIASVGCMGVNVYWDEQPILWVSHTDELTEGTVLSLRDDKGNVMLELTTRSSAVQSVYTSPDLKAGSVYALYIDGIKKLEVTLQSGMNTIGDDGGRFTGGYSRGNMASGNS